MKQKAPSRNTVTTINDDGSRNFVHPADVRGLWTMLRRIAGAGLIATYIALPLVEINGAPAVFLDILHRKLHLFGLTFLFQDLWLLFFAITGAGFLLFFVTSILGRIWCGWACPQTVFLDHVFRRIERLIDGDAPARRKLEDAQPTAGKVARRVLKHGVYLILCALIAHLFLSYFVSIPVLYRIAHLSPLQNWSTFLFVFALTGILYFNFAWFREQFCIVLCPYGRFQSALIDDNSIVIGYDEKRGEPRGKPSSEHGDCVDCRRCVQVCPTGIDIRQGLQLECISCAACIDACDGVMEKLHRPKGLIRHASLNALAGRATRFLRPRVLIYLVLMLAGATAFALATREVKPVVLSALRMRGAPYFKDGDRVRNNFMLRVANKRPDAHQYTISVVSPLATLEVAGGNNQTVALAGGADIQVPLILTVPLSDFPGQFEVKVLVGNQNGEIENERTIPFLGPFRE
ncbi:MAG: cytochrome c oxidase accessory protein CcoG [Terrimicrobiaceae bacterium]|jgi:cytochrome c oxidase accessory protein FixG